MERCCWVPECLVCRTSCHKMAGKSGLWALVCECNLMLPRLDVHWGTSRETPVLGILPWVKITSRNDRKWKHVQTQEIIRTCHYRPALKWERNLASCMSLDTSKSCLVGGSLCWESVSTRQACEAFSWLMANVGGSSSLRVVPPMGWGLGCYEMADWASQ